MVKNRFEKSSEENEHGGARGDADTHAQDSNVSVESLSSVFQDCCDFERREILLGGDQGVRAVLCYIDGLVSGKDVGELVIRPAACEARFRNAGDTLGVIDLILSGSVYAASVKKRTSTDETAMDLLNGFCTLVFDSDHIAVTFETRSPDRRQVGEPKEEKVVKGAKDSFVETIKINSTLVRRKIRDPRLKIKEFTVGEKTGTSVLMLYIDGFTNSQLLTGVKCRVEAIKTEGALTAAVIEENLVDNPGTPFPQIMSTERTDKFCMNLLEGRVGLLVDGLPLGFLAPGTFAQFMKVPEDHANHFLIASALTCLRYLSLFITLLLPAFYVAVAMYHHEMLPTKLMQTMIDAKQSVPFPTAVEVVMMLIAFELLQEAGLRLPSPIGETVSIIGALIVGQSAVEARVVSPVVVVVIALAGIAGYTMPSQDMGAALRICRFLLVLMAIGLGMFGLATGFLLLVHHLAGLESFGVPYMTPFVGSEGQYASRAILRKSFRRKKDVEPALKTGQ